MELFGDLLHLCLESNRAGTIKWINRSPVTHHTGRLAATALTRGNGTPASIDCGVFFWAGVENSIAALRASRHL